MFHFWCWFWPLKLIQGQSDGANGKPLGPTIKCSPGFNIVSVTVFEIFRVKILTVYLLTLAGLTPRPKVTKRELTYWPPRSTILQNFSPIAQTMIEICITNFFSFWLTPGPKFTKRENDLADNEIYHHAKIHRSTPTHARDIPYKISCRQTHTHKKNKQTVNDISTKCLSACVDNKQVRQLSGLAYIHTCRSPIEDHRETQKAVSYTHLTLPTNREV